jgi:hypothetical protein
MSQPVRREARPCDICLIDMAQPNEARAVTVESGISYDASFLLPRMLLRTADRLGIRASIWSDIRCRAPSPRRSRLPARREFRA